MTEINKIPNNNIINNMNEKKRVELREACDMYESLYYKKMLEVAYKKIDIMGKGVGNDIYKDMYLDEMSKTTNGNMGLSKILFDHLKEKAGL